MEAESQEPCKEGMVALHIQMEHQATAVVAPRTIMFAEETVAVRIELGGGGKLDGREEGWSVVDGGYESSCPLFDGRGGEAEGGGGEVGGGNDGHGVCGHDERADDAVAQRRALRGRPARALQLSLTTADGGDGVVRN